MSVQEELQQQRKKKKKQEQDRILELDQRVQELANEAVTLDNEEKGIRRTKKQKYREMAFHLKEKYLLLNQPEKIRDICSEICHLKQFRYQQNIRIDVARSLDSEFKHEKRSTTSFKEEYEKPKNKDVTNATKDPPKDPNDEYAKNVLTELLETTDPYDRSIEGNQKIADLAEKVLMKQEEWSDSTGIPIGLRRRYKKLLDEDKEKITLQPADIPKDERIRLLQQMEGKQNYALSRGYKSRGDSLIKMNYISDDPKISEMIIAYQIREMMILAFTSLQIFNEFMDYFEKFKSKEKLTEEDKYIIRMLLRTICNLDVSPPDRPPDSDRP